MIKKFPLHTFLLAAYFPLALLGSNLGEINPVTIIRLTIFMLLLAAVSLFALNLFFQDCRKAGLVASLLIILFSVYGQLYSFFKSSQSLNPIFGRHRFLAGILIVLFTVIFMVVRGKLHRTAEVTLIANLFAFYLFIMPLVQIALFSFQAEKKAVAAPQSGGQAILEHEETETLPDIYYIILDSYDRQDYLASEFDYDNSEFLRTLSDAGFYIGDCSRSNYAHTFLSLSSTLNMAYIPDFLLQDKISDQSLKNALVHSQFRENVTGLRYQTVAFDNVHWDFSDADTFYQFDIHPILNPFLFPVESVFIDNSAFKLIKDTSPWIAQKINSFAASAVKDHYLQQKYILDRLDESISLSSPKFVFAHIEKPHGPYVFEPNGDFIEEDAFYRDKYFAAINQEYDHIGYIKQIKYLNRRMTVFIEKAISGSGDDPIIIIQGDTGIQENEDLNSRMAILYAVYLPGQDYSRFYPSITPINTFRIIQGQFFSTDMRLLEDQSFYSYREDKLDYFPVEENMPDCR